MNYLIYFGDDAFKYQKQRLKKEAENAGWFENIIVHTPQTISKFLNEHKDFVENSRGYGYWIWKPYIILSLLKEVSDGDVVVYIDSGGSVLSHRNKRFEEYLELLNLNPILVFSDGGSCGNPPNYKEKYFQKMKVLKRFGLENDEDFLNSGQIEAGVFICKKSQESIDFVEEWLNLVTEDNYSLVNDNDDFEQLNEFICHRHDQSILSVLSKLRGVNILGLCDCYGMGPFFSSRMTDNGLREKAPDRFRKNNDYDNHKHYNLSDYLLDEHLIEKISNEIKTLFLQSGKKLIFSDLNVNLKYQFLNEILPKLETIQYQKCLYKIKLIIYENYEFTTENKEVLRGEFYCEFIDGYFYKFNFEMTSDEVCFPVKKFDINRVYTVEYVRIWDNNL